MVGVLRPQPHAGAIRQPQPATLRLPLRHLQPLAAPDPLDALPVHCPARILKQRRGPTVAVAAVLRGKRADAACQSRIVRSPRLDLALRQSVPPQNLARQTGSAPGTWSTWSPVMLGDLIPGAGCPSRHRPWTHVGVIWRASDAHGDVLATSVALPRFEHAGHASLALRALNILKNSNIFCFVPFRASSHLHHRRDAKSYRFRRNSRLSAKTPRGEGHVAFLPAWTSRSSPCGHSSVAPGPTGSGKTGGVGCAASFRAAGVRRLVTMKHGVAARRAVLREDSLAPPQPPRFSAASQDSIAKNAPDDHGVPTAEGEGAGQPPVDVMRVDGREETWMKGGPSASGVRMGAGAFSSIPCATWLPVASQRAA